MNFQKFRHKQIINSVPKSGFNTKSTEQYYLCGDLIICKYTWRTFSGDVGGDGSFESIAIGRRKDYILCGRNLAWGVLEWWQYYEEVHRSRKKDVQKRKIDSPIGILLLMAFKNYQAWLKSKTLEISIRSFNFNVEICEN